LLLNKSIDEEEEIMLIVMKPNSTPQQIENVINQIKEAGLAAHLSQGVETTLIGAIGETHDIPTERFEVLEALTSSSVLLSPSSWLPDSSIPRTPFSRLMVFKSVAMKSWSSRVRAL